MKLKHLELQLEFLLPDTSEEQLEQIQSSTCPPDDFDRSSLKPRRVLDDASSLGRWRGALRGVEDRSSEFLKWCFKKFGPVLGHAARQPSH